LQLAPCHLAFQIRRVMVCAEGLNHNGTPPNKRQDRKCHPGVVGMPAPVAYGVDLAFAEQAIAAAEQD